MFARVIATAAALFVVDATKVSISTKKKRLQGCWEIFVTGEQEVAVNSGDTAEVAGYTTTANDCIKFNSKTGPSGPTYADGGSFNGVSMIDNAGVMGSNCVDTVKHHANGGESSVTTQHPVK